VFAGNGSGKTALGGNEIVWAALGYNPELDVYTPVPARIFIILDKPEKTASVVIPELSKWVDTSDWQFNKNGKPYISQIVAPNGSTITFLFHDQEPMTAEGIEGDFFWFDEPCPRALFIALRRGGRTKGRPPRYLFTGTPISAPWLRKDIYEPWVAGDLPEAECFRFGTALNEKNLIEGYIDQFGRLLTEKERRIRFEGEFFDLDGLALAHLFRRDIHVIPRFDWPEEWPVVVAIDPHVSKRHHACMVGCDRDGRLYYIKEMARKAVAKDFAADLKEFMAGYTVVDIVSDSLGSADMTGGEGFRSFIDVLRRNGIAVRPTLYEEKKDEPWVERIQTILAIPGEIDEFGEPVPPQLRIMEGNAGIVSDIENVCWLKVRGVDILKPKLDITAKDFLSALKYALAVHLHPEKGRTTIARRKPVTTYGQRPSPTQPQPRRRPLRRRRLVRGRHIAAAANDDDD
jgi:phage terminase large subunit-like protein